MRKYQRAAVSQTEVLLLFSVVIDKYLHILIQVKTRIYHNLMHTENEPSVHTPRKSSHTSEAETRGHKIILILMNNKNG